MIKSKQPGATLWGYIYRGNQATQRELEVKLTGWQNAAQDFQSPFYGWQFKIV